MLSAADKVHRAITPKLIRDLVIASEEVFWRMTDVARGGADNIPRRKS